MRMMGSRAAPTRLGPSDLAGKKSKGIPFSGGDAARKQDLLIQNSRVPSRFQAHDPPDGAAGPAHVVNVA